MSVTGEWDPDQFSITDIIAQGLLVAEASAYEPTTQIAGAQIIIDLSGLKKQHFKQFSPSIIRMMVHCLQASANIDASL